MRFENYLLCEGQNTVKFARFPRCWLDISSFLNFFLQFHGKYLECQKFFLQYRSIAKFSENITTFNIIFSVTVRTRCKRLLYFSVTYLKFFLQNHGKSLKCLKSFFPNHSVLGNYSVFEHYCFRGGPNMVKFAKVERFWQNI